MLTKILEENKVPMDKIIGICSDGASTMLGVHKGVCTQLAKRIRAERQVIIDNMISHDHTRTMDSFHVNRGVFVVHCVCHRLALILTDAIKGSKSCAKVIPDDVINLLNMVYSYFARSPQRKKAMRDYIDLLNRNNNDARLRALEAERQGRRAIPGVKVQNPVVELDRVMALLEEKHKLPRRVVLTRWLSCADAVRVILKCRDVYTEFFANEDGTKGASQILELLEDSAVMAWYACMHDVLPVLTGLNVLFQIKQTDRCLIYYSVKSLWQRWR